MKSKLFAATFALLVVSGVTGASTSSWSQQSGAMQDLIDGIIQDVVDRTTNAARETIERNTGVDLSRRGYDPRKTYKPLPSGASDESRRELHRLQVEHDRKLAKLDAERQRKNDKALAEFEREAAKEDKPEKVEKKHEKLQKKVDKAYAKFEEKVAKENERFDEKRAAIISKERG